MDRNDYHPEKVRAARIAAGVKVREAAEAVGLSRQMIWGCEAGNFVSFEKLKEMAILYGEDICEWIKPTPKKLPKKLPKR